MLNAKYDDDDGVVKSLLHNKYWVTKHCFACEWAALQTYFSMSSVNCQVSTLSNHKNELYLFKAHLGYVTQGIEKGSFSKRLGPEPDTCSSNLHRWPSMFAAFSESSSAQ